MTKICIIGVYFGAFPSYFNLWLRSAEYNSSINFLIITDQQLDNLPCNVRTVKMTIMDMRELASRKLGMDVALYRPYKCCDFKPAYGLIFSDYIQQYDYWGHCDFDLIWGDIRSFTDKYHIEDYERFLPYGHLSLYRNAEKQKRLFMLSGSKCGDYRKVFTDEHNYAFDEISGVNEICHANKISFFEKRIFADISIIYYRFRLTKGDVNYDQQIFLWENGKIKRISYTDDVFREDEYIYIHFKGRENMHVNGDCTLSESFFITPIGFYEKKSEIVSQELIARYNPFIGEDYERKESRHFEINRKVSELKRRGAKILGLKEKIR